METEQSKLPSKKIISMFVVVSALVLSIVIVSGKDKSADKIESLGSIVAGEKITIPTRNSWQEELEKIGANSQNISKTKEKIETEGSLTESVSINLVSNYLALKQAGTLDSTSARDLVDKTFSYIGSSLNPLIEKKLNIVADNGKISIQEYGNTLGSILKKNKPAKPINEVELIKTSIEKNNPEKLKELDRVALVYSKVAEEIALMKVPKTFTRSHLDLVNSLNGIVVGIKDIQNFFDDPVKGFAGMKIYDENMSLFLTASKATKLFMEQSRVDYKQGDGGYYLLYGI